MNLDEFMENEQGLPITEEEIAAKAALVEDDILGELASTYLRARDEFIGYLEQLGYEWG